MFPFIWKLQSLCSSTITILRSILWKSCQHLYLGDLWFFFICWTISDMGERVWTRGYNGSGFENPSSQPADKWDGCSTFLRKRIRIWNPTYLPRTRRVDSPAPNQELDPVPSPLSVSLMPRFRWRPSLPALLFAMPAIGSPSDARASSPASLIMVANISRIFWADLSPIGFELFFLGNFLLSFCFLF